MDRPSPHGQGSNSTGHHCSIVDGGRSENGICWRVWSTGSMPREQQLDGVPQYSVDADGSTCKGKPMSLHRAWETLMCFVVI